MDVDRSYVEDCIIMPRRGSFHGHAGADSYLTEDGKSKVQTAHLFLRQSGPTD